MKKLLVVLLSLMMVISFAGCTKKNVPLEDKTHECWNALGQYLLADGTANGWADKATEVFEKSNLTAISVEDVKAISEEVYNALKSKDVKYLYTIDLIFGTNDAGWSTGCIIDGKIFKANGSYALKIGQCSSEVDGDVKVYSVDQWISDPKTAHVESLTPATYFVPTWQEEKDANGFTWADNPVVIGGAGLYTVVVAQYNTVSSKDAAGFGIACIKKEAKEGIEYIGKFIPTEHKFGIVGGFNGWNAPDAVMEAAGNDTWTGEVTLEAGTEFKVRADEQWISDWGPAEGGNFVAEKAGTYVVTITFDGENGTVTFEAK